MQPGSSGVNGNGPQQQIQPQPVPLHVNVGTSQGSDGTSWVVMQFDTLTGRFVFFLPPEIGAEVGKLLAAQSKSAATGLILPPNVG